MRRDLAAGRAASEHRQQHHRQQRQHRHGRHGLRAGRGRLDAAAGRGGHRDAQYGPDGPARGRHDRAGLRQPGAAQQHRLAEPLVLQRRQPQWRSGRSCTRPGRAILGSGCHQCRGDAADAQPGREHALDPEQPRQELRRRHQPGSQPGIRPQLQQRPANGDGDRRGRQQHQRAVHAARPGCRRLPHHGGVACHRPGQRRGGADHRLRRGYAQCRRHRCRRVDLPDATAQAYFSTAGNSDVPGVAGPNDDADIYAWNSDGSYARVFDASVAGVPAEADVDAFVYNGPGDVYLSFNNNLPVNLPGVAGVQDEDIVHWNGTTWSLYFDGSAVGLGDSDAEDVDAFAFPGDGSLLVSTFGNPAVAGLTGLADEDLLRCAGTFGPATSCTWNLYFDGSDILLTDGVEDVDFASVAAGGDIRLSTRGTFAVASGASSLTGGGNQVFACTGPTTGAASACAGFGNLLTLPTLPTGSMDGINIVAVAATVGSADLSITKTDGVTDVVAGGPVSYTIVAGNVGPDPAIGATVTDTLPAILSGVAWTCAAAGGATCAASGSGNLATAVDLPMGGTATFTVNATLSAAATGNLVNTASVATPAGVGDPNAANNSATDTDTITPSPAGTVLAYFSTAGNSDVPGVAGPNDDADIYAWNSDGSYARVFDASVAGVPAAANVDAFVYNGPNDVYLSFSNNLPVNLPGVAGVQDEDIVHWNGTTWSLHFDGSAVGLGDSDAEDVDAFAFLGDGSVLVSSFGSPTLPGLTGLTDKDLLRCAGTFGPATSCVWNLYFDGSDIGLTTTGEDIDFASVVTGGDIRLSTRGTFAVASGASSLAGSGNQVFACTGPPTCAASACAGFSSLLTLPILPTGSMDAISPAP